MTHAERAKRRALVKADFRAGLRIPEIAARQGLSPLYIHDIAWEHGLSHPRGRPPDIACPVLRRKYRNLRSKIGAARAKVQLGIET